MGFVKLTEQGKQNIISKFTKLGSGAFTGKNKYAVPYTNYTEGQLITTKAFDDNGNQTTDPVKFANLVIKWTDQFAQENNLDANILSAQQQAESAFKSWNYSNSGAMGITQFLVGTVNEVMLNYRSKFSSSEIDAMYKNIDATIKTLTDIKKINSYFFYSANSSEVYKTIRKENRTNLFQNAVDNPKIMIKCQALYMAFIAGRNNNVAASTLFAYNRAGGMKSTSYSEGIVKLATGKVAKSIVGRKYTHEGLNYVDNIFKILKSSYGYNLDLEVNTTLVKNVSSATSNY